MRVSLKVMKTKFSPIAIVAIDKYQVGARFFSLRLFNRIKKLYNDLFKDPVNESTSYNEMKNIIDDVNSICDYIRDEDFAVEVKPDNDISIKMLGMYRTGTTSSTTTNSISVSISSNLEKTSHKNTFWFDEIEETVGRLVKYLESENFSCYVEYVTEIADRVGTVSMRKPVSRKQKYEEFIKQFYQSTPIDIRDKRPLIKTSVNNKHDNRFIGLVSINLIFDIDPIYLLDVINKRDYNSK